MTSGVRAAAPRTARPESKARSYARLGKLDVYDYYLNIAVVLSALVVLPTFDLGVLPMLAAFLVGEVLVVVALVAFDDLTGFRDGSDIANYGPDVPTRKKLRKPLVVGTLTEPEAVRFAWATAALGGAFWAVAVALTPDRTLWTVVLVVVNYVLTLQYSYGLKFSYHGMQELFIAALGWTLVLTPYYLATGSTPGFIVVQALLFGLGPLMFGVYSNTNDVEGDRGVGRPTVASLVSPRGNALFIGALSAAEFLIGAVASVTGIAPWWFALLMLPATALRTTQYLIGFRRDDIMRARRLGFWVHRLSVVLLVAANLLHGATS